MSNNIFRVKKNKNNPFVQMYKQPINNENLSFKAKGILAYLLSKPDDWQVYEVDLQNHATDGKTSISNGIKELIDAGYIERSIKRNDKGHFNGYDYRVYEVPTESGFSDIGLSENGKSDTTNNNITKNKETNIYNGHQQKGYPYFSVNSGIANDEIYDLVEYYNNIYARETGYSLYLKRKQWNRVSDTLKYCLYELQLTVDDMKLVIDKYFADVESDHNILHFIDGDIIKHRLVELGLAHYSEVE